MDTTNNIGDPTQRPSLPPVVKKLGAVSFFNDLASEMVYPLLPALVTTKLGAPALALGLLDGISDAVSAFVKFGAGWLADRPKLRGPLIIAGYGIAAVTRPAMGWAGAAWQVIALRATDRAGKGVRNPPRDTVIADATDERLRGRAFGYHRAMDHAGAVLGPLVAWLMMTVGGMVPTHIFTWSIVPGLLAAAVAVFAMRAVTPAQKPTACRPPPSPASPETAVSARPSSILLALIVVFAFSRLPETLFLLRLQDSGVAIALIPITWAVLHAVRASGSYPGGWVSDRLGPRLTMIAGWGTYASVCIGLATTGSTFAAVLWFLGLGVATSLTESPERAFVAASTAGRRGTRFGLYHALVGLAALPGGLVLGWIYSSSGGSTALLASATLTGALAIGAAILTN
ncbi:MAG: MFS transporter [Gemmatimonadales bacterium]